MARRQPGPLHFRSAGGPAPMNRPASLFALFLLLAMPALARVGGGQHYSGSHSSSSHSSSSRSSGWSGSHGSSSWSGGSGSSSSGDDLGFFLFFLTHPIFT